MPCAIAAAFGYYRCNASDEIGQEVKIICAVTYRDALAVQISTVTRADGTGRNGDLHRPGLASRKSLFR